MSTAVPDGPGVLGTVVSVAVGVALGLAFDLLAWLLWREKTKGRKGWVL